MFQLQAQSFKSISTSTASEFFGVNAVGFFSSGLRSFRRKHRVLPPWEGDPSRRGRQDRPRRHEHQGL